MKTWFFGATVKWSNAVTFVGQFVFCGQINRRFDLNTQF